MKRHGLRDIHHELSRRDLLRLAGVGLSGLGLAAIVGCGSEDGKDSPTTTPEIVVDPPPETTTLRLQTFINSGPRFAPLYLAEQFLTAEGFTHVQYIDTPGGDATLQQIASGEIDIGMPFASDVVVAADAGDPLVVLAGIHNSAFVIFGNDQVQSLRDLRGKRIATYGDKGIYFLYAALLAYVGIDVDTEVEFVEVNLVDVVGEGAGGRV